MTTYRVDETIVIDETIVKTENATKSWGEKTDWDSDGNVNISRATESQWTHQILYRSRRGRYYIEHTSQWQGFRPHVEWVSKEEATRWLLLMEYELPEELKEIEEKVSE